MLLSDLSLTPTPIGPMGATPVLAGHPRILLLSALPRGRTGRSDGSIREAGRAVCGQSGTAVAAVQIRGSWWQRHGGADVSGGIRSDRRRHAGCGCVLRVPALAVGGGAVGEMMLRGPHRWRSLKIPVVGDTRCRNGQDQPSARSGVDQASGLCRLLLCRDRP